MKKSTVTVLCVIGLIFFVYSSVALTSGNGVIAPLFLGDKDKKETIYEKDLEGVLGPGDPNKLEIKAREEYLTNLFLKHYSDQRYLGIGEDYLFMAVSDYGIVIMDVFYVKSIDTAFVYECLGWNKGKWYMTQGDSRKELQVDKELYEFHLNHAYEIAVEKLESPFNPHPFVKWILEGME